VKKIIKYISDAKYDIAALALFIIFAVVLTQKPKLNLNVPAQTKSTQHTTSSQKPSLKITQNTYSNIKNRNIFELDGIYPEIKNKKQIPDHPYKLIGVFDTHPKMAILLDYTGKVESVKIKSKLPLDDSIVRYIGTDFVTIQKKNGKYERLKIFEVDKKYLLIKKVPKKYIKE
jgi:hypothetical protein